MNKLKVVIGANGGGVRWGFHQQVPKPLVKVEGIPLLHRTIAQLVEWLKPTGGISIVGLDLKLAIDPAVVVLPLGEANPLPGTCFGESYAGFHDVSMDHLILMGDICWTEAGMKQLLDLPKEDIEFFGHGQAHGPHNPEIFGARIPARLWLVWFNYLLMARRANTPGISKGWVVYRMCQDLPLHEHKVTEHWTEIDQETVDIDSPEDYRDLKYAMAKKCKGRKK